MAFYDDVPMPDQPQEPKLASILVLDTSGSMAGDAIRQLNEGLELYRWEILGDKQASVTVDSCIVAFGPKAWVVQPFGPAEQIPAGGLEAGGPTPMGAGLELALDELEDRRRVYRRDGIDTFRPWIFLVTDGRPTDMKPGDRRFRALAERIREGEAAKRFSFFAIGVDGADMEVLGQLAPPSRPPVKMRGHSFKEFFEWLSDASKSASHSCPGDTVQTPDPSQGANPWAELRV